MTSRAVVGSSAISSSGSQARAIAIITRWAMPPDISCGIRLQPPLRIRDPDHPQQLERPLSRRPLLHPAMELEDLADLAPDVVDRVQGRLRLLEDHAQTVAAELAHLVGLQLQEVASVELDLARLDPTRIRRPAA